MSYLNLNNNPVLRVVCTVFFLLICVVVSYRGLLSGQLLVSDDYELHAARTANYYLAIKQGQFPPRWAPNLNGGFGYPVFNYIYPLPYLTATVLHVLGFSIQRAVNLSVLLALLGGAVGAFLLARQLQQKLSLQTLLALLYLINPYTLLMVYWRGAIGELFFYCTVPYIFVALHWVLAKQKKTPFKSLAVLTFFVSVALLSHLPSAGIFLIVCGAWLLVKKINRTRLIQISLAVVLAFGLTSFYTLPAVLERSLINLDNSKYLHLYTEHFLSLTTLFNFAKTITSSEFFLSVVQVGMSGVVAIGVGAVLKKNREQIFWLTVCVVTLALMTPISKPLWDGLSLLQAQQFPWRLLWLVNLAVFFIASQIISKKLVAIVLALGVVWSAFGYAHPKGFFGRSDYEWFESVITGSSYDEQLPKGAKTSYTVPGVVFFVPLSKLQDEKVPWQELSTSPGQILEQTGTTLKYDIELLETSAVVHKRLYFPGWQATVEGYTHEFLQLSKEYDGLLQLKLPVGHHIVEVSFTGSTPVRTTGMLVSLASAILYVVLVVKAALGTRLRVERSRTR